MQPSLARSTNFVPSRDPLELPARVAQQGQVMPVAPTVLQASPITTNTQSRSYTAVQGKPQDATLALLMRTGAVVAIVAGTVGILAIVALIKAWMGYPEAVAGWIVVTGVSALLAMYGFHRQDMKHSPAGETMHIATEARRAAVETNRDQVTGWVQVETERWRLHYGVIEQQQTRDHEERQRLLEARIKQLDD